MYCWAQGKEMKTEYKYIYFHETEKKTKTSVYACRSFRGVDLGTVKWYAPWRQYCFFPSEDTIFNAGCMGDVLHFIDQLHKGRRRRKKSDE